MKTRCCRAVFLGLLFVLASCVSTSTDRFALKRIPIEIEAGKPIDVQLRLTGDNEVALECSPELWHSLTSGDRSVTARLVSSSRSNSKVGEFHPGKEYIVWGIPDWHYLFRVAGEYHARVKVEITFPNAPAGITKAYIILGKIPSDFGL
jgi:hypothetical protein